jgi:hypothetical protein
MLLRNALVWYENGNNDQEVVASYGLVTHQSHILTDPGPNRGATYPTASPEGDFAVWTSSTSNPNPPNGVWPFKTYSSYAKIPD